MTARNVDFWFLVETWVGDLLVRARTAKHAVLDDDVPRFEARTVPEHACVDEFAQRFGARTGPERASWRRAEPTSRPGFT